MAVQRRAHCSTSDRARQRPIKTAGTFADKTAVGRPAEGQGQVHTVPASGRMEDQGTMLDPPNPLTPPFCRPPWTRSGPRQRTTTPTAPPRPSLRTAERHPPPPPPRAVGQRPHPSPCPARTPPGPPRPDLRPLLRRSRRRMDRVPRGVTDFGAARHTEREGGGGPACRPTRTRRVQPHTRAHTPQHAGRPAGKRIACRRGPAEGMY